MPISTLPLDMFGLRSFYLAHQRVCDTPPRASDNSVQLMVQISSLLVPLIWLFLLLNVSIGRLLFKISVLILHGTRNENGERRIVWMESGWCVLYTRGNKKFRKKGGGD